MTRPDDELMVPDKRAAEIADISVNRLRYWDKTGLVSPDTERRITQRNVVRLYSLGSLVELVVASELRRQGVSLQHIRTIIRRLRSRYEAPLRQVRFARAGERLLFQHDDGTWEDTRRPYQGVMWQVIDLRAVRAKVRERMRRSEENVGVVAKQRKVLGSKPVFLGTRVPVEAVERYLDEGKTVDEILRAFPTLTREDVAEAQKRRRSVA